MLATLLSYDFTLSVHLALAANYGIAAQLSRHDGHGALSRVYAASALLYGLLSALHGAAGLAGAH